MKSSKHCTLHVRLALKLHSINAILSSVHIFPRRAKMRISDFTKTGDLIASAIAFGECPKRWNFRRSNFTHKIIVQFNEGVETNLSETIRTIVSKSRLARRQFRKLGLWVIVRRLWWKVTPIAQHLFQVYFAILNMNLEIWEKTIFLKFDGTFMELL